MTATDLEFAEVHVPPVLAIQMARECPSDPASIGEAVRNALSTLMRLAPAHGLALTGPPRAIYTDYSPSRVAFTIALPVAGVASGPFQEPGVRLDTVAGTRAYRFTHHGPYVDLSRTYGQVTAFMIEKGFMQSSAEWNRYMPMWEEYLNDPARTPASELMTHIFLPVR